MITENPKGRVNCKNLLTAPPAPQIPRVSILQERHQVPALAKRLRNRATRQFQLDATRPAPPACKRRRTTPTQGSRGAAAHPWPAADQKGQANS